MIFTHPIHPATRTKLDYITFSRILHAVKVFVKGKKVAPIDPATGTADIGAYLRDGENELLVVVPTTMWNYLRSIPPLLSHLAALMGLPDIVPNGLVGEVSITPMNT